MGEVEEPTGAPPERFLFPPEDLPPGFRFPAAYLEVVGAPKLPELMPWWFLAEDEELALFWRDVLLEQFPERSLVPFAKWNTSDDLACFDGADASGNPAVLLIHAYTTPGGNTGAPWPTSMPGWPTRKRTRGCTGRSARAPYR